MVWVLLKPYFFEGFGFGSGPGRAEPAPARRSRVRSQRGQDQANFVGTALPRQRPGRMHDIWAGLEFENAKRLLGL